MLILLHFFHSLWLFDEHDAGVELCVRSCLRCLYEPREVKSIHRFSLTVCRDSVKLSRRFHGSGILKSSSLMLLRWLSGIRTHDYSEESFFKGFLPSFTVEYKKRLLSFSPCRIVTLVNQSTAWGLWLKTSYSTESLRAHLMGKKENLRWLLKVFNLYDSLLIFYRCQRFYFKFIIAWFKP